MGKDKNIGMDDVYFSIVIPLYNKEKEIARTLESIFNQTYKNFEVVIVNDGSTDESVRVVESMTLPCPSPNREGNKNPLWHSSSREGIPIRVVEQENGGVSAARNRGIEEAKYDYIALLDGDDEWKPEYLETQVKLIKKYPEASVFVTNYEFKNEKGEVKPTIIKKIPFKEEDGILSNYFEVASNSHPPICSITIVAKKESFKTIGGFPLGIKSGEDLLTWARLACRYKIAYNKKPLAVFNIETVHIKSKPKRSPSEIDEVGERLLEIKREFNPLHINQYLSLWHKMRSSIYMRLGQRTKSNSEAFRGLKYNPLNYKLYVYIALNFLPKKFNPYKP